MAEEQEVHGYTPGPDAGKNMRTMSPEATARKFHRAGIEPVSAEGLSDEAADRKANDLINDLLGRPHGTPVDLEELGDEVSKITGGRVEPVIE